MKNIENQCTTLEQSKRLWEMGFSRDTASARIVSTTGDKWIVLTDDFDYYKEDFPCWTVGDMMDIIHNNSREIYWEDGGYDDAELIITNNFAVELRDVATGGHSIEFYNHKPLLRDNLFDCLVWLKENKYL